jgi:NAD(P)-dependent dehydrogenase (short-subunit alcohol dehydrogenase family)
MRSSQNAHTLLRAGFWNGNIQRNASVDNFPQKHVQELTSERQGQFNEESQDNMRTVLITGANRGLGLEFARQYAADAWQTIATARQIEKAKELRQIAATHTNLILLELDIAAEESIERLSNELDGRPIDLLLHNSGIYPRKGQKIGQIDYDGWREAIEINLFGTMRLTETLLENVVASEGKQIAAISTSMASIRAVQGGAVALSGTSYQYRTSKTALNMALSILAKELQPRGVSVTIIDPGWVKTDMGGPRAQLTPEQSISGIRRVLAGNPMEISGKFLGYDGARRPW